MKLTLMLDGAPFDVVLNHKAGSVEVDGQMFPLHAGDAVLLGPGCASLAGRIVAYVIQDLDLLAGEGGRAASGPTRIKPPMTGKLLAIQVQVGQLVGKGDVLFVLEAMKMQNEVRSPAAGTVTVIHLKPGATLETSQVVLELGPASP